MATREDFCSYEALESHCTALSALSGVTTGDLVEAITNASELMWALTGRQFGAYTETVRPDLRGESASWFDLRRFPVTGISSVKIDGATVPSSAYWVRDGRHLVRTDETSWPQTQKLYLDDTEDETFSVTLTWGAGPPAAVVAATRRLACELLSLKFGGHSGLPDRVRSTVRQGISMEHVSAEDLLQNGRTGIYEIDFALETFNRDDNAALPSVMSPDIGWNDHDGTTTVGAAPSAVGGVSEDYVTDAISAAVSGLGSGGVASVDGRTGAVTLDDLYEQAGATQALADTLGTAATTDASGYATAAQGATADTAVQPGDLPVAIYYYESLSTQPWVQPDADFGASASGNVHGHVTRTDTYWADATITFYAEVTVTTPGTGVPQFLIREVFQSIDPEFNNWYWGWSTPSDLRCPVNGQIGGLPFVGTVRRNGDILDADGNAISRVLQTGDWLAGTVTGVFQND
jgi:hypothetical protein